MDNERHYLFTLVHIALNLYRRLSEGAYHHVIIVWHALPRRTFLRTWFHNWGRTSVGLVILRGIISNATVAT